jgi:hypothetical protein
MVEIYTVLSGFILNFPCVSAAKYVFHSLAAENLTFSMRKKSLVSPADSESRARVDPRHRRYLASGAA